MYVVKDMTKTHCTVNPDEYYNIDLLNTTSQPFAFPILGMCDTGYSKFIIDKNCHYIKSETDVAENMICGVLCENPNYVYTMPDGQPGLKIQRVQ